MNSNPLIILAINDTYCFFLREILLKKLKLTKPKFFIFKEPNKFFLSLLLAHYFSLTAEFVNENPMLLCNH